MTTTMMKSILLLSSLIPFVFTQELECSLQNEVALSSDRGFVRNYYNQDEQTVTVQFEATAEAWVGLGLGVSRMVESQAVIGLPSQDQVDVYLLNGFAVSLQTVQNDQTAQLTNVQLEQTGGSTILTFTQPLEGEGFAALDPSGAVDFIYAWGTSDEFGLHAVRGVASMTLAPCTVPGTPTRSPVDSTPSPTTSPVTPTSQPTEEAMDQVGNIAPDGSFSNSFDLGDGLVLDLTTDVTGEKLFIRLTTPEQAWLGFGLGASMVGSEAVIGLPDEGTVQFYSMTSRTNAGVQPLEAGVQTLQNTSIVQNDTHTVMEFTRNFNETADDLTVDPFGVLNCIYAVGLSNVLTQHGSTRGGFMLNLSSITPDIEGTGPDTSAKWLVHGLLMGIAWGVLIPIGIGMSLLRSLVPLPEGYWFKFHAGLNFTAFIATIVAMVMAILAINDETLVGEEPNHFDVDITHRFIGLIIIVAATLQVSVAMARPNAAHHNPPTTSRKREGDHEEEKKSTIRFLWECKHRLLGVGLLALAWFNCHEGLDAYNLRFGDDLTTVFWAVTGAISGSILLIYAVQTAQKMMTPSSD